tara:strand:- start:327 stop:938 length:612 start_codon:yes stop_codon:yes gene_type:complete
LFAKTPKILQRLFPSLIWSKKTVKKEIWLTFDDGPDPTVTPWILNILKQEDIKATFFLVGKYIERYPTLLEKIIAEGHKVGNHSYSHKNGWVCKNKDYVSDIYRCQQLLYKNTLFRPPYGRITKSQISILKQKYKIVLWDVFSWDFQKNITPEKVKKNILMNTESGSIIVLHNNRKSFNNIQIILRETIHILKQKGFIFSNSW